MFWINQHLLIIRCSQSHIFVICALFLTLHMFTQISYATKTITQKIQPQALLFRKIIYHTNKYTSVIGRIYCYFSSMASVKQKKNTKIAKTTANKIAKKWRAIPRVIKAMRAVNYNVWQVITLSHKDCNSSCPPRSQKFSRTPSMSTCPTMHGTQSSSVKSQIRRISSNNTGNFTLHGKCMCSSHTGWVGTELCCSLKSNRMTYYSMFHLAIPAFYGPLDHSQHTHTVAIA